MRNKALFAVIGSLLISGCLEPQSPKQVTAVAGPVQIIVNADQELHKVNPMLLGNNIQWVDRADGLFKLETLDFDQELIRKIKEIKTPILRFPGGTFSDVYHWKDGVGPVSERKKGVHIFLGREQDSLVGTDEFLKLAKTLNAESMITVNTLTGTPEEAADWVRYCNLTKKASVRYWEVGNEPYLQSPNQKTVDQSYPDIFARKFIEFSKQMKLIDPSIQIGLPLRSNLAGRYPGGPYKNWNERVFRICAPYADFVSLHNAYFPMIFKEDDARFPDSFLSLMAAPEEVRKDLEQTQEFLRAAYPGKEFLIALTEYNAFFAAPSIAASRGGASLGAGLYVASLLTQFFNENSVAIANYWSLLGNWYFGTLNQHFNPRPQYFVLKLFSDFLGDRVVSAQILNNLTFNSPAAGYMPAKNGVSVLDVLSTRSDSHLFLIFVNKSLTADLNAAVRLNGFVSAGTARGYVLTGPNIQSDNEDKTLVDLKPEQIQTSPDSFFVTLPKHSVMALKLNGK